MKVITYLCFTLLSVAIQFVFMDFIQGQFKEGEDKTGKIDLNNTTPKKKFTDILKQYAKKPHALYYQMKNGNLLDSISLPKSYSNNSLANMSLETSTDFSSTIVDLLYDENTTESEYLYTTTEADSDNNTELSIFENKKNKTVTPQKSVPKKAIAKDCDCDLLYHACDINCCCDSDCTGEDQKLFSCDENALQTLKSDTCYAKFSFLLGSNIDELFCVVKNNLPEKRKVVHDKHDSSTLNKHFKWRHTSNKANMIQEFKKKPYKYGDPIWILRNGTVYYVDLPSPMVNSYCGNRKPLRFLKDETIKCTVKLADLEILQILSTTAEQTSVISVTEKTTNATTLNCSTLHCTNWTIIICNEVNCTKYNNSVHNPKCTDNICTNVSLKVVYTFYYHENKIMNATIKLYTQKLPLNFHLEQEVNVRFVISKFNETVDSFIEHSGNPGYISNLPLIVAYSKSNYTEHFYNSTSQIKRYMSYPLNVNGMCESTNMSKYFVSFAINKRVKCRYNHVMAPKGNETNICNDIQNKITDLLQFHQNIVISPLGNPYGVLDQNWVRMSTNLPDSQIYGEYNAQKTKLYCYNLVTRYSLVFTFADVSDKPGKRISKVLSATLEHIPSNVTLNVEDLATVLTVDSSFIDETKQSIFEYAAGPQLDIHLPKDFFFPYPPNQARVRVLNNYSLTLITLVINLIK